MPSWDPEAERTASCRDYFLFFFKPKDSPPGPPPGEGEVHPPSPEAVLFPSGSPVLRPLAFPLSARFDGGLDGRGGLPTPSSTAPLLRMRCGSRDGCRGRPRRRAGWGAAASGRVEAAAARWAGCVGSPQSAPKQPRTAGPCSRLCRRRCQSGTQGP